MVEQHVEMNNQPTLKIGVGHVPGAQGRFAVPQGTI
jgi:hypothetical protein